MLLNMLSRLVITFLPRSKRLLISWLQSPSVVILEPRKIKSDNVSNVSPSISHEVMGPQFTIWTSYCKSRYLQREMKEYVHPKTGTWIVIVALFTMAKKVETIKCPWTCEWINILFSSVQSLSGVQLFATPWTAARQASLSITSSWSSLKLTSIK